MITPLWRATLLIIPTLLLCLPGVAFANTVAAQLGASVTTQVWHTGTGSGAANDNVGVINLGTPFTSDTSINGFAYYIKSYDDGTNVTIGTRLEYADGGHENICVPASPAGTSIQDSGLNHVNTSNTMQLVVTNCAGVLSNPIDHTRPIEINVWAGSDAHQTKVETLTNGSQMYYQITDDGSYSISFADNNPLTHIVSFTPDEGTTTGSVVNFDLHVHIAAEDLTSILGVQLTYESIDQNQLLNTPLISHNNLLVFEQATTSGEFYFSATSSLPDGNYRVKAQIQRTVVGTFINPFSSINDTQNHQFIVNQETYIGHLNQNGFREFNALLGSTTATSTAASAANCNPLTFSIGPCLGFLFIPGGPELDTSIKGFKDGVITRLPWGYFYRFYNIIAGNTGTSSLPTFTVEIDESSTTSTTLTFDPGDMLAGGANLVSSLHDKNGHTFKETFEPMVLLIVALAVIFQIFADLTGSHEHADADKDTYRPRKSGITVSDNRRGIEYEL